MQLHEDLHAAELRNSEQQDEISRLRSELEARPLHPEKRIVELQDEVSGLKLIASQQYPFSSAIPAPLSPPPIGLY